MCAGLEQVGRMRGGETVLVTAAAGGTGQFVVQLAKAAGNTVVATCGSDDKAALLRRLGVDRVVNYRKENLKDVLRREYPKVRLKVSSHLIESSVHAGICHQPSPEDINGQLAVLFLGAVRVQHLKHMALFPGQKKRTCNGVVDGKECYSKRGMSVMRHQDLAKGCYIVAIRSLASHG